MRAINKVYSDYSRELSLPLQRKAEHDEDLFYSNSIQKVSSQDERDNILAGPPCCIIASSGMLIGGRSSNYAKHLAGDPKNMIAITGYQAEGTPGQRLQDLPKPDESTQRELKLDDEKSMLVKCMMKSYSLSAHADSSQLTALVEKVQPHKLFLVHGESDAREKLAQSVRAKCRKVKVVLPANGNTYTLKKQSGIAKGRQLRNDTIIAEVFVFVTKMGRKGPFSVRELTEIWFGTEATTLIEVTFFLWCLSLDYQFFVRDRHLFYPRQPV